MVSVRPAAADSIEARELLAEYFEMRAATFPGAYTPVFPARGAFDPPAGVFLIVADEGEPAGCGGIRRIPDGPRGIRYEVKHLFLRPATRGRGWGRLLLDELERHAREWGAGDLVLDTHHTLEAAAGLYASAGFVSVEAYNDNPNATVWLCKVL